MKPHVFGHLHQDGIAEQRSRSRAEETCGLKTGEPRHGLPTAYGCHFGPGGYNPRARELQGVGTLTFRLPHLSLIQRGLLWEQVPWPSNEIHIGEAIPCQVLFIINWWVYLQIFPIICWLYPYRFFLSCQNSNANNFLIYCLFIIPSTA